MDYCIEIIDTSGRRIAALDEVPLLEVAHTAPDKPDTIRGLLPTSLKTLGNGYRIRVQIDGQPFVSGTVTRVAPQWSDTRRLILDRYVSFLETLKVEAETPAGAGNTSIASAYLSREISAVVKHAVNAAPGRIHYLVDHAAYPDGAQREYSKFLARKDESNDLEYGGIASGQWVGGSRIDASSAYASGSDTIAGLVVDGQPWPDLRLMMIDAEETSRNAHAQARHPEVAGWSDARYAASGYKLRADAATAALQDLLDTRGVDFIELNPHRDITGAFDGRVDACGRYIGLVYGSGECLNAAMVEKGAAEVYLHKDGRYLVPEMALKEFFSYAGTSRDSIEETGVFVNSFDTLSGVFEVLTALACIAGPFVWSVGPDLAVSFREAKHPDRVVFSDPMTMGVLFGSDAHGLANTITVAGHPFSEVPAGVYCRQSSINTYGDCPRSLDYFALAHPADAEALAQGLLDDLAYPEIIGEIDFFHGNASFNAGDLIEVRGDVLFRREPVIEDEWGGRFSGAMAGRVSAITHRFTGKRVRTRLTLTSPLRSVADPLAFIVNSQPPASALYCFRLDEASVGLDSGFHLD